MCLKVRTVNGLSLNRFISLKFCHEYLHFQFVLQMMQIGSQKIQTTQWMSLLDVWWAKMELRRKRWRLSHWKSLENLLLFLFLYLRQAKSFSSVVLYCQLPRLLYSFKVAFWLLLGFLNLLHLGSIVIKKEYRELHFEFFCFSYLTVEMSNFSNLLTYWIF